MMADNEIDEALASLDVLMSEFFAPTTSNFRKREIESMLENFSNRSDSWKHCLLFLQKSQNQYVLMFTLTTLENIINRQWISLSDNVKTEVRLTLWNELLAKHEVMAYFIRNKLAALMVSIARYDWPHLYDDFFSNIVELIRSDGPRCLLGLVLAQAASEELGAARDTGVLLPSARRNQLERLMLKGMPQLLIALSDILEKNAQKEGQSNPPPSPTNGVPQTSALPDLLANAHDVSNTDKALNMEIVVKCLTTLQHLFSWLPLSSHVPPSLVTTVFYWGSIATQSQSVEAALCGLGGVCELLYRRYAPPSSAATALRLQHCALRLLRHLTHTPHAIMHAHHDYLNKLAEFLKLFVSLHFKRLEAEPEFDAIEFLSYLFQYTFQVPTCAIFVNCLDIWIQFIDILKPEDTPKYWEALQALVNGVLNKIQFQHNKAQLQHLDNDIRDDDGQTEWHTFLKHCIECIARVAELAPLDVFTAVLERWQCLAGVHARAATRGGEGERLLAALLDLATLTRVLGRLAPALLAETESSRRATGWALGATLVERMASALAGAALTRPHRAAPLAHLAHAHVQVHAEMFACMGAWCCYANECGVPVQTMEGLFSSAIPFLLPHEIPEPPLLCHAAAHLLLSLAKNVKFNCDPVVLSGDLYEHAQRSLQYLPSKTAVVVREALISLALRGGAGGTGQAGGATRALLAAWGGALPERGPAHALPPLTALLHAFSDAPTQAKKAGGATRALLAAWGGALPERGPAHALPPLTALLHAFSDAPTQAKKAGGATRALLAAWGGALPKRGPAHALPPLTALLHAFSDAPTQAKKAGGATRALLAAWGGALPERGPAHALPPLTALLHAFSDAPTQAKKAGGATRALLAAWGGALPERGPAHALPPLTALLHAFSDAPTQAKKAGGATRALLAAWGGALPERGPAHALPPLTALLHAFSDAPTQAKKAGGATRALLAAWGGALPERGPAHALPPLTALLHAFSDAPTQAKKAGGATRALLAAWGGALPERGPAHALPPLTALLHAFSDAPTQAKKAGGATRALLAAWGGALPERGPAHALPPLTALLHAFSDAPTQAKKAIAEGIQSSAETALRMLCEPSFASAEAEITDFFLALFTALLPQLGNFAYNAIDVFLEVAQRGGGESGLERLVECVRLGIEAGGGGMLVRSVLVLLQRHVLPRATLDAPDLARAAYKLLASVLIHRWRYFFPNKCDESESNARTDELRGALAALGRALLQPDIELLRLNIDTLDALNTKCKLYHKVMFRTEFLGEFLSVLLLGLAEGGWRALARDEVTAAVHAMALVDFPAFRSAFLPHFLASLPGLTPEHQHHLAQFPPDTDLPSFTQNIQRLMNDVNCYRAYSSLAPVGMAS
ncbi:hypothetical protein PYW08_004537 [Mythimna loreyi]|uniref:Uncharacterized protein n=1 Tax=Mythimna loreyi TaxID=667449 RepID=A0ACC2QQ62_9NEOP|nr:hypothetical protein PYW08_004537 [Mythimna loreyi]